MKSSRQQGGVVLFVALIVLIIMTLAGLALLRKLDKPVRECHLRQLGHLNAEQLRQLVALLKEARQPHEEENSSWR